mgnify:CR=1 FL=1
MSEKRLILVVEDERTISNFICRALTANDYKAMSATTGKEALSLFFSHRPDLVLLDLGLPDMDGLDVLKELSGLPQEVPVIIISARDRESEKVKALDMGADDYVVKPFGVPELLARIRTTLRRADRINLSQGEQKDRYQVKDLVVDTARHQVFVAARRSTSHRTSSRSWSCSVSMPARYSPMTSSSSMSGALRGQQQPDPAGQHGQHPPQAEGKPLRAQIHPDRTGHRIPDAGGQLSLPYTSAPPEAKVRRCCFSPLFFS